MTIDNVFKIIKTNEIGRIKRIHTKNLKPGRPWMGIIGPEDDDENDFIFHLVMCLF